MSNNERLEIISSLDSEELTTKNLIQKGLTSSDIRILNKKGIIIRIKKGLYKLNFPEESYDEIYNLFYSSIIKSQYSESLKYLIKLYNITNDLPKIKELNFYTYLLDLICELPNSLQVKITNITIDDILFNIKDKNLLALLMNKKYHKILHILDKIKEKNKIYAIFNHIIDIIVTKIGNLVIDIENKIKIDDLQGAKEILEHNEKILYPNMQIKLYLINILLTEKIPSLITTETSYDFISAIKNNDFTNALKYHKEYSNKNSDSTLILLQKVKTLIDMKKQINKPKPSPVPQKPLGRKELLRQKRIEEARNYFASIESSKNSQSLEEKIPTKDELKVLVTDNNAVDTSTILNELMHNNCDLAYTLLNNYLNTIGKIEYEFLIIDLIKISLLEKDSSFLKPISTLAFISRDNFTFNLGTYLEEFYMNLANNNFQIAYLYLDIIEKAEKLGINFVFINNLKIILKSSKEKYDQEYGDTLILHK